MKKKFAVEGLPVGQRVLLLAVFAWLAMVRYPWLLLHGRLWGEEGPVYLGAAWTSSWESALVAAHQGYFAVWPNLASMFAARVFPLPAAALVMTWCAFLIELLAAWCVVECEALPSFGSKATGMALLLLLADVEVWMNTLNSQFYLVLCAAFIFISRPERLKLQRNLTLALAALTGPLSTSLAPFFLLRAILARTRAAILQAAVLTACAALQVVVVLKDAHAGARHILFEPMAIAPAFLVRYVIGPFTTRLGGVLGASVLLHQPNRMLPEARLPHFPLTWGYVLLWSVLDVGAVVFLFLITRDRADRKPWALLGFSLWITALSMYGAYEGTLHYGERYAFAGAVLVGVSLLLTAIRPTSVRWHRAVASFLVACMLVSGATDYLYYRHWAAIQRQGSPDWQQQAARRASDPTVKLPVWPKAWLPGGFALPAR